MEPPVLLLDEPLSNLDTRLRQDLRVELMRLQRALGFTAVYVTHDQSEALSMSSSVAVMRDGAVEQLGTPQEIYDYPRTRFVAAFLGSANLLKARILTSAGGGTDHGIACYRFDLETDWGAPIAAFGRTAFAAGTTITAALRPEGIGVLPSKGLTLSSEAWTGVIETAQFLGDSIEYQIKIRDRLLRARSDRSQQFAVGDNVAVEVRSKACTVLVD
jgi:ABC-type Fe3+/spermidine/putrescine transport system ATPase subunit